MSNVDLTYWLSVGLLILFLPLSAFADEQGRVDTLAVGEGSAQLRQTAILIDSVGTVSLRQAQSGKFREASNGDVPPGSYLWQRLALTNQGHSPGELFVEIPGQVDSLWFYVVNQDGALLERSVRSEFSPRTDHYLTFMPGMLHCTVRAGETLTLYVRSYHESHLPELEAATVKISPVSTAVNRRLHAVGWHALYAGLMIAVALLSLLNYWLFRERAFIYFALVNLSFAGYFSDANLMLGLLGLDGMETGGFGMLSHLIANLIVWITCFCTAYIKLPCEYPRYFRFVVLMAFVAVAAQYVFSWIDLGVDTTVLLANTAILLWIVTLVGPIVVLGFTGKKTARQLLTATAVLGVPGVLYIIDITLNGGIGGPLLVLFELSTIGYTILIFARLYTEVNAIRAEARTVARQNELNTRFFANISHEFRTPLTLIMGPIERLMDRYSSESEDGKLLRLAHTNAKRQLNLVNRVLQLSRLEANEDELQVVSVDLAALINSTVQAFSALAEQRGIRLGFSADPAAIPASVDRSKVEEALLNLLSNALKFTPAGGSVRISVLEQNGEAVIHVIDDGIGIRSDRLPIIFDRFAQTDGGLSQGTTGSGLGLSLVRELIRLHGGRVSADSELGKGTVFTIHLPLGRELASDVAAEHSDGIGDRVPAPDQELSELSGGEGERPLVLVVEDNRELRQFIRYTLQGHYRIAEAIHGEQGIEMATRLQPAVILSDVMMPVVDGYELLKTIKSQFDTSHIPVILLTARASTEARLEGLGAGADDYITKPFNDRELLARIRNLIQSRKLLREKFATASELEVNHLATTPQDEEFLLRAVDTVKDNLSSPHFKVQDFAVAMQMSKASLNRKLRGLLDQSSNQFIQSIRLKSAYELINSQRYRVAEVAEMTGFSSSAYFIRLYRERYGSTPGNALRRESDLVDESVE